MCLIPLVPAGKNWGQTLKTGPEPVVRLKKKTLSISQASQEEFPTTLPFPPSVLAGARHQEVWGVLPRCILCRKDAAAPNSHLASLTQSEKTGKDTWFFR